tara:strand:+ start:2530 stop:2913 length:384 start_codon:yes stop_codon:yes gene_type:complete
MFIVRDLDKMEDILMKVLDAKRIYNSDDRTYSLSSERFFFDVGAIWVVTMVGGPLRDKSYNHVVFKMTPDDYNDRLQRIPARGLELKEGRSRVEGKGRSIYCIDNDNHMFELHSGTLQERLRCYSEA